MFFKFHIGCSHPSSSGGPALGVRPSHVTTIMPRVHIRVTAPPSHNSRRFWIKFSYKTFYGDHHILVTEHMAGFRKVGNPNFCNIVKPRANSFLSFLSMNLIGWKVRSDQFEFDLSWALLLLWISFHFQIWQKLDKKHTCKDHIQGRIEDAFTDLVSSSYNPHTDGWHHRSQLWWWC